MNGPNAKGAPSPTLPLELVGHVETTLSVELGDMSITLSDLFGLTIGQVLTLQQTLDDPVTLMVNGKAVARGELLAVEDRFAVRICGLL